jgi:Uri superfamily endonuclease
VGAAVTAGEGAAGLPRRPGAYVVRLVLARSARLKIGALGQFVFPAGTYLYIGSARGPGGLAARVGRHLRPARVRRWHVDYLRRAASVEVGWWREGKRRRECAWAQAIGRLPGATAPAPRFGASDCRCESHLWLLQGAEPADLRDWLR